MHLIEDIRKAHYDIALMNYNEAYYKWLFGPEKDKEHNSLILAKMRSIWFAA
jgi:hypothetical protein